jgi:phosphoglycolate/pyridoxal phosphate phosphatase family enzyme
MSELIEDLKNIKVAIFDLDGVVYRGDTLIPDADKIINKLKDMSIRVMFNSNNSTATRQTYVERLKKFNITSEINDYYTSASITSAEISRIKEKSNIFVIGEVGLREELKALGHRVIIKPTNYQEIDFVIVGLDRNFSYENLSIAQRCVLEGNAQFYATNADTTLPVAGGLLPGAGVMVNALATCVDKEPIRIFGKPEPFGIELILKDTQISPEQACIFGDRLNTDILAGNRAGITSVVVLTGVTTKQMINKLINRAKQSKDFDSNILPDLTINKLNEIFKDK